MAEERTRNWVFILYPESAHPLWRSILDDLHIPWAESPLHEFDMNADGTAKKPHWHIVLTFDGSKSYKQILEICNSVYGTIPEKVHNLRSMIRYLAHLDNPEKWQYDINDIIAHGGMDIEDITHALKERIVEITKDICNWCDDNDIVEFSDIADYARLTNNDDWYTVISRYSTLFLKTYITSRRHKRKAEEAQNG